MKSTPTKGSGRKPRKGSAQPRTVAAAIAHANAQIERVTLTPMVTPRVFTINSTQATNVSGYITTAAFSSALITACPDFTNQAGLFLEYRCVAMELTLTPYYVVNTTISAPPAKLSVCAWNGGTSPSTYQGVSDGTNPKIFDARKQMVYSVSADTKTNSPNMLWNSITIGIPVSNSFGIAFGAEAAGPTFTASTVWASYTLRLLGEFKYAG
jgi:hypothetical protein